MKNNKGQENYKIIVGTFNTIVSILVVLGLLASIGNKIVIKKDKIKIVGISGITIKKEDIKTIELIDNMPKIIRKIKGISSNGGLYEIENGEKAYIYMGSSKGPLIKIVTSDANVYLSDISDKGEELYKSLKKFIDEE